MYCPVTISDDVSSSARSRLWAAKELIRRQGEDVASLRREEVLALRRRRRRKTSTTAKKGGNGGGGRGAGDGVDRDGGHIVSDEEYENMEANLNAQRFGCRHTEKTGRHK